jgi:predicted dehydrogenase
MSNAQKSSIRVAMIGHGFMGAAHSQGWRVAPRFFDLPVEPELSVVVGRHGAAVKAAASRWGWTEFSTDWREVVARDDIDIIDIVTPGDTHAEIAIAALQAGKHVLCEKPLANSVSEAVKMADAAALAAEHGVFAMTGFSFRRVPAVTFARDLIAAGKLGEIYQVRASYLQDWLSDPKAPMVWRLNRELAGSGALGDIAAHIIDMSQFITGLTLGSVSGTIETIIPQRPIVGSAELGEVTVDDAALFTGRYQSAPGTRGVLGIFEATRCATGRKNTLRIEVSGAAGAIAFDLDDMNSLQYYDATALANERGFTKILVTEPQHPYIAAWWPPGHVLGYEHGFSNQVSDFITAITSGVQPTPSFADGLQVQRVLAAIELSSGNGSAWTPTA